MKSPYSGTELPIFMTGDGEMHVDYSIDLGQLLKEDKPNVKPGDDIRQLLVDKYPVVPAYSIPYTVDEKVSQFILWTPIIVTQKAREKQFKNLNPKLKRLVTKLLTFVRSFSYLSICSHIVKSVDKGGRNLE